MMVEDYEPPPDNSGVRLWARVVQATLIILGGAGWLMAGAHWAMTALMVAVTVVIEVWGFHAYAQWSLALARQRVGLQMVYWFVVVLGCASWTVFSIYHAIPIIAGEGAGPMGASAAPAYVAFAGLALTLPLHEWAIDRVERAPLKPTKPVAAPADANAPPTPAVQGSHAGKSAQRAPKRASGPLALRVIQNAGIAAALAGMGYMPRDAAGFERAAMIARENPNLTPDEIAEQAGVQRGTLSHWMNRAPDVFRVQSEAA